jgi:hypothetical protein
MDPNTLVLATMGVGLASILVTPILTWILGRQREKALEALKAYAENGREPPPELLRAIAAPLGDAWGVRGGMSGGGKGALERWSGVVMFWGLAAGFGLAAYFNEQPFTHPFWIVAMVTGALGAGALVHAVFAHSRAK